MLAVMALSKRICLNKSKQLIIIFILLFNVISLVSLESLGTPYRLINSDHLQINRLSDEYITYLRGNVHFFYDDIEFKADKAEIYEIQQYVKMTGNVIAIQDTLSINCHEAQYYHLKEFLRVQGNVLITETGTMHTYKEVKANVGEYDRLNGMFTLKGNIKAWAREDSLHATAGFATYDLNTGYGYMIQKPIIWKAGQDSISLSAEKIEFYNDIQKIVASFDVVTKNKELKATSNFLIYYGTEEKLVYIGNPKVFSNFGDAKADLITAYLKEKQIDRVEFDNNCLVYFNTKENEKKENMVKSSQMKLFYENGKPIKFNADNNVETYFVQNSTKKQTAMNNRVFSNKLRLTFDDEMQINTIKLDTVTKGKYRFERKD